MCLKQTNKQANKIIPANIIIAVEIEKLSICSFAFSYCVPSCEDSRRIITDAPKPTQIGGDKQEATFLIWEKNLN